MDQIINSIDSGYLDWIENRLKESDVTSSQKWKAVICPHDDYAYAGPLYSLALSNLQAKTVIIFGVAHKAILLKLKNQLIFDSFDYWQGPYGRVKVSDMREELIRLLPVKYYQVNDSMQQIEHSVEAIIPFLQSKNKDVEIVSVLVPAMHYDRMNKIATSLAETLKKIMQGRNLSWGEDLAIVISNDAVHYGDEGWGNKTFAWYGADSAGYEKAVNHEQEIIHEITGRLTIKGIHRFCKRFMNKRNRSHTSTG